MIDLYIIAVAALAGLLFINRIQPALFRLFVPYLSLTLLIETAVAFNWPSVDGITNELYNVFTSFELFLCLLQKL